MTTERGWMYILRCSDGSYYVGSTNALDLRLAEHEAGEGGRYTSCRLPVKLVYSDVFPSVGQAYAAEVQVKGWSRAKKEALIAGRYELLPALAKSRGGSRNGRVRAD